MQIILPCDNAVLRSTATQRPSGKTSKYSQLSDKLEKALAEVIER